MTWVQNLLDDETVFPTKSGASSPLISMPSAILSCATSCSVFHVHSPAPRRPPRVPRPVLDQSGRDFSPNFPSTVKHVYRQLLRVFAHLYHAHYPQILHLRSEGHFNSLFAHFLAFGKEYELLEPKDIKGQPGAVVGIGALWEKWKEMGILESS